MKKSRCIVIVMLIAVLFTSINPESIVYASQETIIARAIRYSENSKEAEILFNVEGVEEEKYELITIISNCDDEVIYDGTQDSEEITYTVKENGEYSFTIRYIEKEGEKQEEKTEKIVVSVTEIKEESETEIEEEEEIVEEVSIVTLSDSSEAQADASTDTITIDAATFPDATLRKWVTTELDLTENQSYTNEQIEEKVKDKLYDSTTKTIRAVISSSSGSAYAGITNIQGLQNFTTIQEVVLTGSSISSISSDNLPKSLESLTINNANNLTDIDLEGSSSSFHTLTASNDKKLTDLKLPQTITKLTLNSSGLTGPWDFSSYLFLAFLSIDSTNITSLNVSGCSNLENLYTQYASSLTKLELPSSAPSLKALYLNGSGLSGEWDFNAYTSLQVLLVSSTSITGIDVSGCTSLHTLNVRNNPLAYLELPNTSIVSAFTADSLSRDIDSLALSVSEGLGLYISLDGLFTGINKIDKSKISNVNVENGTYDSSTKIIKNITGDFTVTYQYDTGDTSHYITTTINVTIDISSLLPTVTGVDGDFGVSSTIGNQDKLRTYGKAKRYGSSTTYSLSEIASSPSSTGLKITEEKYYYFNYSTGIWNEIREEQLLNFEMGIGVYAYEFKVQDTRDSKLVSTTGLSRFFVGGEESYIKRSSDNCYVLIYDSDAISITETVIAAKYSDTDSFKSYLTTTIGCQGYQDSGGREIKVATPEYNYSSLKLDSSSPVALTPNNYTLSVNVKSNDSPSESKINKDFTVKIEENPYSYDLDVDDESTLEGISGYLIIPKYIVLENTDGDTLSAEVEVKFANYQNATDVKYSVSVDQSFEITNTAIGNTITVTTSSEEGIESGDKLDLGTFTTANIDKGKMIKFTATKTEAPINSKWEGQVTFYFSRTS